MNRPRPALYLIGNPLSVLLLLAITAWLGFNWWQEPEVTPWWMPLFTALLTSTGFTASQQIEDYKAWQRRWHDMGDGSPAPSSLLRFLRILVTFALSIATGLLTILPLDAQGALMSLAVAAVCFTVLNLAYHAAVATARKAKVRRAAAPRAKREPDPIVAVCLPVPKKSALPANIYTHLPRYCLDLLGQSLQRIKAREKGHPHS